MFCASCGAAQNQPAGVAKPTAKGRPSMVMIMVAAMSVVALIAAIAIVVIARDGDGNDTAGIGPGDEEQADRDDRRVVTTTATATTTTTTTTTTDAEGDARLPGLQTRLADLLIDEATADGLAVDERCTRRVLAELSDSDARALLDDDDDGLSADGGLTLLGIFECFDFDELVPTDGLAGAEVLVTGPERDDPSVQALNRVLGDWGASLGVDVRYIGDADWEANLNTQVEGGNPPDISIFPQPGKLADFARDGFIVPLDDQVVNSIERHWAADFQRDGIVGGVHFGVPTKTDVKSLVWFVPSLFERAGYPVPGTYAELEALIRQMVADGGPAPWCVGIESGQATGWVYTDWVEEMVLRLHGGDVYDRWVTNDIAFDDPRIVEAMLAVLTLWTAETGEEAARQRLAARELPRVLTTGGTIAQTNFSDPPMPLLEGECYMHRQASFLSGFFPTGTRFADGSAGAVDVFYFPDINGDAPVLTAGTMAAAFNDDPATMALLEFMASAEFAEQRQAAQSGFLGGGLSGFMSAAQGQDPSVYQPLEQRFLEILLNAELARFDASDLMPAAVGAGSFWNEGTNIVNGDITASEGAARIQRSWP